MAGATGLARPLSPLRIGLAALGATGAALLVATTFLAVIEIVVGGTSRLAEADTRLTGWERHGPALLVLGAFAAVLVVGAARGARPATAALGACGLAALGLVLAGDLPDLDETGLIGALYSEADASPGPGWYTEIAGAVLLVVAAAGLLLTEMRARPGAARRRVASRPAHRISPARVRAHCLALPETSERPSHGAPTFFIRQKRAFVTLHEEGDGDGHVALWAAAPEGAQAGLVGAAPDRYFVPPYVGSRGWVGVRLDRDVPWDEIAGIIEDAYVARAPKGLVEALREGANSGG
jgi:hypothetical protein